MAVDESQRDGKSQEDDSRPSAGPAGTALEESAVSVLVRSDWHGINESSDDVEYEILLCWGGPAVRITGELGGNLEPQTAVLQYQDWFTPWTAYDGDYDERLLVSYAALFLGF